MYRQIMKAIFIWMTIIVAIVIASSMTFAEETGEKIESISDKDYKSAFTEWGALATKGDKFAQYNLGVLYQNGFGVEKDYVQAQKWYILSSGQENSFAQDNLDILAIKLSPSQRHQASIQAKNCLNTDYVDCVNKGTVQ